MSALDTQTHIHHTEGERERWGEKGTFPGGGRGKSVCVCVCVVWVCVSCWVRIPEREPLALPCCSDGSVMGDDSGGAARGATVVTASRGGGGSGILQVLLQQLQDVVGVGEFQAPRRPQLVAAPQQLPIH